MSYVIFSLMNFYDYLMEHDIRLTEQQRAAVNAVDGAVLLLAVPGSGKTTVLVARLGYMIFVKHIDPESILTLTYTVAATRDMAERFRSLFGDKYTERLEFRTINGVCARIINFYGRRIGKQAFTLVTDEKVTTEMLGRIFQQVEKTYATESDLKTVRMLITYIKNMMLDKADQAIGRITRQMGYNNYLERNKMNEGKIAILRSLSYQENSPKGLLDRLEALQLLLKDKDNDPTCKFVLSTIHSSKGLEYDTVYLMDVMDGLYGGSRASGNFAPKVKLYGGRDFTGKKIYKEH